MGRTFKHNEKAVHQGGHKWVFTSTIPQKWGATVNFVCENPGCPTTLSLPVKPDEDSMLGNYCVNRHMLVEVKDEQED